MAALGGRISALETAPQAHLIATVALGGVNYVYDSVLGVDLGNYVGAGFIQQCRKVTRADCPLVVHFRPDMSGARNEVVFELSALMPNAVVPVDLGPYSVTITKGTATLATISVPKHFYYSRWRWQSAPRPKVNTVASLIAANRLPKYVPPVHPGTPPPQFTYSIMGLAGIYAYMPTTGERNDIGPVTEWQGYYIATGNGLGTVIAQGDACGTLPWHRRAKGGNTPTNFDADPQAHWYSQNLGGGSWYPGTATTGIVLDCAHMPAAAYLPFMLTGDPYYLEELQFEASDDLGRMNPATRQFAKGLVPKDQTRSYAWSLRALMQLAAVTPDVVPSWLLPRAYWLTKLENNRAYFTATWINGTGDKQTFHIGPVSGNVNWVHPWEEDFLAFVMLWAIRMGHTAWQPVATWKLGSTYARTNGTSGWPRAFPAVYEEIYVGQPSWVASWAATVATYSLPAPPATDIIAPTQSQVYAAYARGVLAAAGGGPEFAWLDGQIVAKAWSVAYKWSVGI